MNNNTSEHERKELNKKLLKRTFVSEIKSKKRKNLLRIVIDFVSLFIAFVVVDLIVERLQIKNWLFEMVLSIAFVMIVQILVEKLKSKF